MNRRIIFRLLGLLILGIVSLPLLAADLSIDYLEGDLEYRQGRDTWIAVDAGDNIPEGSSIRLAGRGFVELSMSGKTVTLTKDGLYESSELFSTEEGKTNFRQVIGSRFSALLGRGKAEDRSSVAAVRAAEAETDDFISWEDESTDFLTEGLAYLEDGDIEGALEQFEDGSLWEAGSIQRECDFRMGLCLQILGRQRDAREVLTAIRTEQDDPFLAEYTVVVGALYLESMEYSEADKVTASYLESNPRGEAAQAAWLLSAYSLQEQGKSSESHRNAQRAIDMGADTEIGKAAAELIQ